MSSEAWLLQYPHQVKSLNEFLMNRVEKDRQTVSVKMRIGKTRSGRQAAALEVWCRNVAELFNSQGITREVHSTIYGDGFLECEWRQETVKNEVWRPMQVALTQRQSTTEASTLEMAEIYEGLVRAFGNKGVQLPPWPIKKGNEQ